MESNTHRNKIEQCKRVIKTGFPSQKANWKKEHKEHYGMAEDEIRDDEAKEKAAERERKISGFLNSDD